MSPRDGQKDTKETKEKKERKALTPEQEVKRAHYRTRQIIEQRVTALAELYEKHTTLTGDAAVDAAYDTVKQVVAQFEQYRELYKLQAQMSKEGPALQFK